MSYTKTTWQDSPSTATPITAANLNHLETQYDTALADVATQATNTGTTIGAAIQTAAVTATASKVPSTRLVAGHALSADVTISAADVGLGNVQNRAVVVLGPSDPVPTGTAAGSIIIRTTT